MKTILTLVSALLMSGCTALSMNVGQWMGWADKESTPPPVVATTPRVTNADTPRVTVMPVSAQTLAALPATSVDLPSVSPAPMPMPAAAPVPEAAPVLIKPRVPKAPHGSKAAYVQYLRETVQANTEARPSLPSHPVAQVEVRMATNGRITAFSLIRSSGVEEWDKAVLQALTRTKTLPLDHDGHIPAWLEMSFTAP